MLNSPIKWIGGKRLARKYIIPMIPVHKTYIEIFGGAAWILFGKKKSKLEVYNDIYSDLINLWRIFQSKKKLEKFIDTAKKIPISRELFYEFKQKRPKNRIRRAVYFYYILKTAYGGKLIGTGKETFANKRLDYCNSIYYIDWDKIFDRLKFVIIENLDFEKVIKRYDAEDSFHYIDPPYFSIKTDRHYKHSFTRRDHLRLKEIISEIKGKFILSYDHNKTIKKWYKNFNRKIIKIPYSCDYRKTSQKYFKEYLIWNYDLDKETLHSDSVALDYFSKEDTIFDWLTGD